MNGREEIKCNGNVKVNVCNLKQEDILILSIPDDLLNMEEYEKISGEAKRLSGKLEKDLGFKVPVIILAGDVTYRTMNRQDLLDILDIEE